jgi:hypothetical protein
MSEVEEQAAGDTYPGRLAVPPTPETTPVFPRSAGRAGMNVDVTGNKQSQIIVAGGDVRLADKPPLLTAPIPETELDVVRRAWVSVGSGGGNVATASDAVGLLVSDAPALAVITGPAGHGKRAAGVRALWEVTQAAGGGAPVALEEIQPDWDKPEHPDVSLLPDQRGTGYLLDVATEIRGWEQPEKVAQALVSHAEALRRVGSYLVVVADEHGWPEDAAGSLAQVVVRVKSRPSPHRVASAHLEHLYQRPERLRWLSTVSATAGSEFIGQAARLLDAETSTPADAARLAASLARTEDSDEGLKTALASFQEWRTEIRAVFAKTEDLPADRSLLISAVFLSGDTAVRIQEASRRLLGKGPETDVEVILSGPDLTTRLERINAQVIGRHATLDHRPGYSQAILNELWHQRPDIHTPLLSWLDGITAPGQPGAARLPEVSDLLVELAIAENDIRVIDQVRNWIDNGNADTEHLQLVAGVLTKAAVADSLGAKVRSRLLTWASAKNVTEPMATVIALVCRSEFAEHYPRQSLVRLRHVLDRPEEDLAVQAAKEALGAIAASPKHLPRVWALVINWATEQGHLAGHRAFLTLLDPQHDPHVLQAILAEANQKPEIKQAVMRGWNAALADPRVAVQCRDLMIAWAHARAASLVPYDLVTGILRQVVTEHMYTSPVAALVFGEAGVQYDEPVIALRKDLQLPIRPTAPAEPTAPADPLPPQPQSPTATVPWGP